MRLGATEYLRKPFAPDTLAQTIRSCLQLEQTTP
jgi:DNA-binding NtrC family response regulator